MKLFCALSEFPSPTREGPRLKHSGLSGKSALCVHGVDLTSVHCQCECALGQVVMTAQFWQTHLPMQRVLACVDHSHHRNAVVAADLRALNCTRMHCASVSTRAIYYRIEILTARYKDMLVIGVSQLSEAAPRKAAEVSVPDANHSDASPAVDDEEAAESDEVGDRATVTKEWFKFVGLRAVRCGWSDTRCFHHVQVFGDMNMDLPAPFDVVKEVLEEIRDTPQQMFEHIV